MTAPPPSPAAPPSGSAAERLPHAGHENAALAARLREYADLLEQQQADGFRVAAYRHAANVVERLGRPLAELFQTGGLHALIALPAIGRSIAAALAEMITTGRWSQLDRVRGSVEPDGLFRTIAGIGPALAARLADELHLETLEDVEAAAHDGRLAGLAGFGPRRLQMVRTGLAERLGRLRSSPLPHRMPPLALLVDIDREYRRKAEGGTLRAIAPRRFNPERRAWLPILHVTLDGWEFAALFSNSALAHRLGRIGDWVILFYDDGLGAAGQCTVVTQRRGPHRGARVIRGDDFVAASGAAAPTATVVPRPLPA